MQNRICFVYPWATFGGVERVLLNRALAFKKYAPTIKADFYFPHDSGGLSFLLDAMRRYELTETAEIVFSLERDYDLVCAIDCPQAIDLCHERSQRYVVECHTAYAENRGYLANLPSDCARVITPSQIFSDLIRREFPRLRPPVSELRNFVPWDIHPLAPHAGTCLPPWGRKPILFFGRLDTLKDPLTVLEAFKILNRRRPNEFMLLFCGPKSPEIDLEKEICKQSLRSSVVSLPPIPFAAADRLFGSVAHLGGIFVSPSRGESFGLSAAEAISSLVPVVLSDIDAHISLVNGFEEDLTYHLGDINHLANRIEAVFNSYDSARKAVASARNSFSAAAFIKDWQRLFGELGIGS